MDSLKPYRDLSHTAKLAGGPEALVKLLTEHGVNKGKQEMMPIVAMAATVSTAAAIAVVKAIDYFKRKKKESEEEFEKAKAELIRGIEEYDAEHPEEAEVEGINETSSEEE